MFRIFEPSIFRMPSFEKLNFFVSSFTGASNARFVETRMTFSTCVVYNIWCLGTFNFLESKAIAQCRSAIFAQFRAS